ncbi:MAG: hypothetical protein IT348_13340 [Candidatus Eisenbacteria bacterium]|nr:hypothetical protein [Candidatus Eisenbacteria bacterium]
MKQKSGPAGRKSLAFVPVRGGMWPATVLVAVMTAGCQRSQQQRPELVIANPHLGRMTIAVAPALNQSGSLEFDTNRVADAMAVELSFAEGISVVPVSRVLAALSAQGASGVTSPEHALELTRLLGVDAILVFSVTEYDPHEPPSIGITGQLYGKRAGEGLRRVDPVALSREAGLSGQAGPAAPAGLLAQTQRVFDASHGGVADEVREFAAGREGLESPYGWKLYLVSQQHFMRFCCHATVRALMNGGGEVASLTHEG